MHFRHLKHRNLSQLILRQSVTTHPPSLGGREFEEQKVEVGVMSLRPGDRFLISSDGLHDALTDAELATMLGSDDSIEEVASQLIDSAVQAGSNDDISLVVLDVAQCEKPRVTATSAIARAVERVRGFFVTSDDLALAKS